MPRGGSTFGKRQKEQARQQKQRDKAERRIQRKQDDRPEVSAEDEARELRELAEAQAALFRVGSEDAGLGSSDPLKAGEPGD
jgi:hypothetical protein